MTASDRIKIVSIIGNGRSGSTILESIINNNENIISVGECFRFWERFYKDETFCGCGASITECALWTFVHRELSLKIKDYSPSKTKQILKEYLQYKHFNSISLENQSSEYLYLIENIKVFFAAIFSFSNEKVILESSKSVYWAKIIETIPELEVYFLHLERDLTSVASSWKKRVKLPEFKDDNHFMPVKSDLTIIRTWVRTKFLASKQNFRHYKFISFKDFCQNSRDIQEEVFKYLDLDLPKKLLHNDNHAIAGNPLRSHNSQEIQIRPYEKSKGGLNTIQIVYFSFINWLSNRVIK